MWTSSCACSTEASPNAARRPLGGSDGRTQVLQRNTDDQADAASVSFLPHDRKLRAPLASAEEERQGPAGCRRKGPGEIPEGAELHGAPGRYGRVQKSPVPETLRYLRHQDDGV